MRFPREAVAALVLAVALPPSLAAGQDGPATASRGAVYVADAPAPERYAPLAWQHGDELRPGFWFTATQTQKIAGRVDYLEQAAAKSCVDAQIDAAKPGVPPWVGVVVGIVGGLAAGYVAAQVM